MVSNAQALWHPNIQVQTVLRYVCVRVPHLLTLKSREVLITFLVTRIGQFVGLEYSMPGIYGDRSPKPQLFDRRFRERDPGEDVHLTTEHRFRKSTNQTGGGLHHQGIAVKILGLGRARGGLLTGPRVSTHGSTNIHRQTQNRYRSHVYATPGRRSLTRMKLVTCRDGNRGRFVLAGGRRDVRFQR